MKRHYFLLILLLAACSRPQKLTSTVAVSVTADHRSVQFKGLDRLVIGEISRDTNAAVWQSLVAVYKMPADTDLKSYQPVQPGKYRVQDSVVVFTPDTPFVKGKTYFVRNYRPDAANHLSDYIKGQAHVGSLKYIDLIFKP
ncbi:hypothetical protein D0C36_13945 [Mucilaginibacter conchicola]|uniref:Uncharacterized protein n=1 Tax=Mucilaginibacter conchicola TaxID=2303333 RepID=A0A372NTF0_9SPHI|nr:hypothetical protein [Mucilaginibacter conchicola]RFZ92525.1 hypothetical protein D0C36_13945 [Mucilaginibacter conchicola]